MMPDVYTACPLCGALRVVKPGAPFPTHASLEHAYRGRLRWCPNLDPSTIITARED